MALSFSHLLLLLSCFLSSYAPLSLAHRHWPVGGTTRFYEFKVQTMRVTKLCKTKEIVTVNGMFPGPTVYAQEDDRIIVRVTNDSPYNATIHWHGVRQRLTCWADGPSYITQCPIQTGQTYTYEFTMFQQKGTFFWHAHISWLRATVHGAIIVYPKTGVPYPFPNPYEEHVLIFGEYWLKNIVQLEKEVVASGGASPPANAFIINGRPGPRYNCSKTDVFKIDVVPGKTYLLRLISASMNMEHFFAIAGHKLTIVEADAEYTKAFTVDRLMIAPGQTINVLVKADQQIDRYDMALGPYMSAQNVSFQNISSIAHFQYTGAILDSLSLPAQLPVYNDSLVVNTNLHMLRSLNATNLPLDIDTNLFFTIGLNVDQCHSSNPNKSCQGPSGGVFAASMNNVSFVKPNISLLEAYYDRIHGYFTDDFPGVPLKTYDFVNGAPNNIPNDTQSLNGTKVHVLEYGSRVQLILQDTGTVTTENHPIHLHGYSFYVVGYGTGNYNPMTAKLNLVDPPYMNTIGVPVGGWAAIRFIADNPGVWFMHCHFDVHLTWGLSMAFIVKNGNGPLETLPHPPADLPRC
ncbi:laccase-6 [Canna indica]|uniref:Laccase n=1 Tax=Canna indica TaxID=4628 RepID=A0AAQ3KEW6_9LILI|nr:laccase-6 [Canna indica]